MEKNNHEELKGVIVRAGTVRDWPFIQQLALESIHYSMSPVRGVSKEQMISYRRQSMSGFWAWVQRSQSKVFVAEEKERIGYLILNDRAMEELTGGTQAWVMDVAVKPEYWGKGVARKLMQHAEEHCMHEEIKFIGLAVTTANQRAASLYQSLGYQEERKLMVKKLKD
jgi:ribosomal protein S18 acetylase RimI-like enzyme